MRSRCIERPEHGGLALDGTHLLPLLLGEHLPLFLFLSFEDRFALGDFRHLILILLLYLVDLVLEELFGGILRFLLFEGAYGHRDLVAILLNKVCLEHLHLLVLALLDLLEDLVDLGDAPPRQFRECFRHDQIDLRIMPFTFLKLPGGLVLVLVRFVV